MKYLILDPRPGVKDFTRVACFCAPTLHKDEAEKWAATHAPVAAGFIEVGGGGAVRTFGRSDSLGLAPRPNDAALIASFIRATLAMAQPDRPAA